MTDYTKASGSGLIMIRDLGSTVEYWIDPYYSDFWWTNLSLTVIANGVTHNFTYDYLSSYAGAAKKVYSNTVSASQTVTFKLNTATGTSSLGGPTTLSAYLSRATVPPAPDAPVISLIGSTTCRVAFTDNGNGGAALNDWAIALGTSTTPGNTYYPGSDKTMDFTGLTPGTTYYVWSRVANSVGWSAWSPRSSFKTLKVPDAPTTPTLSNVKQLQMDAAFSDNWDGGATVTERQLAYNTSNTTTGATLLTSDGSDTIPNLLPGTTYYVWARVKNSVGWSDWSGVAIARTVGGVWVKDGGVWKEAVAYVNVAGVWKVAQPWARRSGIWIEST